jgi:hypothetical protein
MPPVEGAAAIRKVFEGFVGAFSIVLEVVNIASKATWFTERVDRFDWTAAASTCP